jgi:hypothetical protein
MFQINHEKVMKLCKSQLALIYHLSLHNKNPCSLPELKCSSLFIVSGQSQESNEASCHRSSAATSGQDLGEADLEV